MIDQLQRFLDALEAHGCKVRRSGDGWIAQCPCAGHRHDDRHPSLSISEGRHQPIVTRCHTFEDHDFEAVCLALGLDLADYMQPNGDQPWPTASQQRPPQPPLDPVVLKVMWQSKRWTASACERLGVGFDGERITFAGTAARYAPEAVRMGEAKMLATAGSTRGLWPAPDSMNGKVRWLVEGEPDAVTGHSAGLPCVAVPGTNGWKPSYAKQFKGLDVVVCMDADLAGRRAAERIVEDLLPVAASVRVLDLAPKRDDGYDLTDALVESVDTEADLADAGKLLTSAAMTLPPREAPLPDGLYAVPASKVKPRKMEWLWPGRVPLGALTLLTGMPGLGKSTLACELAGRVSRDGDHVLMVSAEDAWDTVLRPRLEATQAELSHVHFVAMRRDGFMEGLILPDDVHALHGLVEQHRARLVVIDPLVAHLSAEVSTKDDHRVRLALAPMARMAEATRSVVLPIHHLNKNTSTDPVIRIGGSIGIPAAARAALLMERDPDDPDGADGDQRVLAQAKGNYAKKPPSLLYAIEEIWLPDHPDIDTSRIVEIGESPYDAETLLGQKTDPSERSKMAEAITWLSDELSDGAVAVRNLKTKAEREAFSWRTIEAAKQHLNVIAERAGFGSEGIWSWRLPEDDAA